MLNRYPDTFTDNMRAVVSALYANHGEMTPTRIGQMISPQMKGGQLTGPLRALQVAGWVVRRKETVGREHYGYREYDVVRRWYRLTDEGRAAWVVYLAESGMIGRLVEKLECDHYWMNHYNSENAGHPDARLCVSCGRFEPTDIFGRPTRFPDLHDHLTGEEGDSFERQGWWTRAISSVKRAATSISKILRQKHF